MKFSKRWNSIIKGGEEIKEEREEDLFVQFDQYENFRSRGGSSRAQEDATGIVFGP